MLDVDNSGIRSAIVRRRLMVVSMVKDVAKEIGKSETTIKRLRTLADLIPELSTSSMARAIKRLYEIRGIEHGGDRARDHGDTLESIAEETGKSIPTIKRLRTLADLIPELSTIQHGQGDQEAL